MHVCLSHGKDECQLLLDSGLEYQEQHSRQSEESNGSVEREGHSVVIPGLRYGDDIHVPTKWIGS